MKTTIVGKLLAAAIFGMGLVACYVDPAAPTEECRTVEVRNRHDVEMCVSRCSDDGCRTHCSEREQWSREHRCWVE